MENFISMDIDWNVFGFSHIREETSDPCSILYRIDELNIQYTVDTTLESMQKMRGPAAVVVWDVRQRDGSLLRVPFYLSAPGCLSRFYAIVHSVTSDK